MITLTSTETEARAAYDALVQQWRAVLPMGGARHNTTLPVAGLHPAHVGALFPVLVEDVYDRVLACLVSESVPAHLRIPMIEDLRGATQFAKAVKTYNCPEKLSGGKDPMDHWFYMRKKMYWLADDLDKDRSVIESAGDNLTALSRLLAVEMESPQLSTRDIKKLIDLLNENFSYAFMLAGFVATSEPYLDKLSLRPKRNVNFTVGVPKVLKRKDGTTYEVVLDPVGGNSPDDY